MSCFMNRKLIPPIKKDLPESTIKDEEFLEPIPIGQNQPGYTVCFHSALRLMLLEAKRLLRWAIIISNQIVLRNGGEVQLSFMSPVFLPMNIK